MFNKYPYTDAHELNLDMIINMMRELHHAWDEFTAVNKITNDGAWNINKQYQAWTVVSDNNIGYISLKPVPAGVAITNTEYWGVIADYDILITDLSNRISTLETQMLDTAKERRALYIGNSYCGGVGSSTGDNGIFARTKNLFGQAYQYVYGGAGFLTYTGHTVHTFGTMLDEAESNPLIDNDKLTDVIFVGAWGETCALIERGQNDFINDVFTAVADCVTYIKNHFPNVNRIFYTLAESRGIHSINTSVGYSYYSDPFAVNSIMKVICERSGMEYGGWIGFNIWQNDNMMSLDHYHPNDSGYTVLEAAFKAAYMGTFKATPITSTFTLNPSELSAALKFSYIMNQTPDETIITITDVKMDLGESLTQYASGDMLPGANTGIMIPVPFGDLSLGTFKFYIGSDSGGNPTTPIWVKCFTRKTSDKTSLRCQTYTGGTSSGSINKIWEGKQFIIKYDI